MKKIFFIIPNMESGGTERKVTFLLRYFQKKKYDLTLILIEKSGVQLNDVPKDIRILDLKKKNRFDFFKVIIRLGKILKREKPDAVISFAFYANVITLLAKHIFGLKSKIVINEESFPKAYLLHGRWGFLKKKIMGYAYKKADKIICISKGLSQYISSEFKIPPDKIRTIYNPIELERIQDLALEEIRHPYLDKRKQGYKLIISVGRLTFAKRIDILLKAFAKVRKKTKVLLLILGDGPLDKKLKKLRKELNLEDRVDFLGYVNNPYSWMAQADLFVLTSQWEGFGMVIPEAMTCGIPIIFTDCFFGPNEIITHEVNGMLIPPGDVKAASEAIESLLDNEKMKKEFVREGKKRAQDFRSEKIASEYERTLNRL